MNNQYLAQFQIIGTSIKNLKIKNDFVAIGNGNNLKRKIDVSHAITSIESLEEDKILSGTIVLNIKVLTSANKKRYSVDLSIEGCFNAPSEMGEDKFKEMLQVNGVTSLYSIARGFVQSVTAQTLVTGNILLPMFNVAAYSRDLNAGELQ